MKKQIKKNLIDIFVRYIILIVVAFENLAFFYLIFTPLTIYPLYFLLRFFYQVSLSGTFLFVGEHSIEIIRACIAGSAYYLLLILNLTTRMPLKTRILAVLYSFLSLLIINILRIFVLSVMFIQGFALFELTHKLFWYALSIIFVIGIWFSEVWIFKIKNIPVYNDILYLKKLIKNK